MNWTMIDVARAGVVSARVGVILAGLVIGAAHLAPAVAQNEEGGPEQVEVTESKLRAFASATLALQDLGERYESRFEAAETGEERARIIEEANLQMILVVDQTPGITLPEYDAISEAAREDAELGAVVDAAILAEME